VSRSPYNPKIEELVHVLEELGHEQAIIFFNFKAEAADIKARLAEDVVIVDGDTPDKAEAINKFKSGGCRYLAANIQSLAHGVTLVNARHIIYYSNTYSAEDYAQSRARVRRIGQTKTCVYIHLHAKDTIDGIIYNVLKRKGAAVDIVAEFMR
jgi:SNF2 family DNA or RNA helicase